MPGRLPDVHRRFEHVTLPIWQKHGIRHVAFWTTLIGADGNNLYYLLEWESLAERERRWQAFSTDPEWLSARALSEQNGPIVERIENMILAPTSYSPLV